MRSNFGSIASTQAKIKKAKASLAKAQISLQERQLTQKHWDKLASTEKKFQDTLAKLDFIYPEHKQGRLKILEKKMGLIVLFTALAVIGSTAALYFVYN